MAEEVCAPPTTGSDGCATGGVLVVSRTDITEWARRLSVGVAAQRGALIAEETGCCATTGGGLCTQGRTAQRVRQAGARGAAHRGTSLRGQAAVAAADPGRSATAGGDLITEGRTAQRVRQAGARGAAHRGTSLFGQPAAVVAAYGRRSATAGGGFV